MGRIQFYWIPSHVGIHENELVDTLAKTASNDNVATITELPFTDFRGDLKKQMKDNTVSYLHNMAKSKGVRYFENYFSDRPIP